MFGYVSNVVSLVISLSFVVGPVTKVWTRIWLLVVPPYMNSCNLSYPSFTNLGLDQYPKDMYLALCAIRLRHITGKPYLLQPPAARITFFQSKFQKCR